LSINHLPVELLREIFILATLGTVANTKQHMPKTIRLVCQLWRKIIDNAGFAWTLQSMYDYQPWKEPIERSGNAELHIALINCEYCWTFNDDRKGDCDVGCVDAKWILGHAKRITCLRVTPQWLLHLGQYTFPRLKWLNIDAEAEGILTNIPLACLDKGQFPTLKQLVISEKIVSNQTRGLYCDPTPLPPHAVTPHDLRLVVDADGCWLNLVSACAHVLKTLVVRGDLESVHNARSAVVLPLLECLSLENHIKTIFRVPMVKISFDTPNLIYCVVRAKLPIAIHFNHTNVRHLRTDAVFNIQNWTNLKLLQTLTRLPDDLPPFGTYKHHEHRQQPSSLSSSPPFIRPDREQRWKNPIPGYDLEQVCAISS
jgi:hypothetical protein